MKKSGEVLWEKELIKPESILFGLTDGLVVMPDNNYVFSHYKYITSPDVYVDNWPVNVSKISSDGNQILWEYVFESKGHDLNNFLFKAKNNDIIGGGMHLIVDDGPNKWNQEELGWIYRISKDGKLLWQRKFADIRYNPFYSTFNSGLELPNGDLVFGGSVDTLYDPGNPKPTTNCWVIKVDSNGCILPDCLDTIFVTSLKNGIIIIPEDIIVYPNIATDHITVQIPESNEPETMIIIDMNGRIQKQMSYDPHINISQLVPGIYIILFYWENGKSQSAKFIKKE